MIITTTLIIGTSIGLATGIIGGGITGYFIRRNRRERELDEQYQRLINYYSEPQPEYITPPSNNNPFFRNN